MSSGDERETSLSTRFLTLAIIAIFGSSCDGSGATAPPSVASIAVNPGTLTLVVSQTATLSAVPYDSKGNSITGRSMSWSTADTSIATVSGSGVVTAVNLGSTTISASSEGKVGFTTVSVVPAPVATIAVTPPTLTLAVGSVAGLAAELKDQNGRLLSGRTVSWTSSDTVIAHVSSSGLVTARKEGSVTVAANSEGKSGTALVTVTAAPVATVTVSPPNLSLEFGATFQLSVELRDKDGRVLSGRAISWTSSDSAIAKVSSAGLVTGVKQGSATVTASSEAKSAFASVTVTAASITSCQIITSPGDYVVSSDVGAAGGLAQYSRQFCLVVQNTSNVKLSCGGHVIYGIRVDRVTNFTLTDCVTDYNSNSGRGTFAFFGTEITNLAIDRSVFYIGAWLDSVRGAVVTSSIFSGDGIVVDKSSRVIIANNVFDYRRPPYDRASSAYLVDLQSGGGNVVKDNVIDGGWDGDISNWSKLGADDGIIINHESSDTLVNNRISNTWDAGIETAGEVANSLIANNTIANTVIGIGGWWDSSVRNTAFIGNSVSRAHSLFTFFFAQNTGSSAPCGFIGNQFTNNRLSTVIDAGPHNFFNGFNLPAPCAVQGNTLEGNDFAGLPLLKIPGSGFTP